MTPAQKCNSWSLNFVFEWGQGEEGGRKMVVSFKCVFIDRIKQQAVQVF